MNVASNDITVLGALFLLGILGIWTLIDFVCQSPAQGLDEELARDLDRITKERRK